MIIIYFIVVMIIIFLVMVIYIVKFVIIIIDNGLIIVDIVMREVLNEYVMVGIRGLFIIIIAVDIVVVDIS